MRDLRTAFVTAMVCTPIALLFIGQVSAQVMESGSYRIESDSINFGGGLSTSSSYTLESTAGEIATGESASDSYRLKAGYQQMREVYLALATGGDVTMAPTIGGVTGGISYGTTTATVTTDGLAGYELTARASLSPALQSSESTIADYTPVGANPDFTFTTDATDSHFGYSPQGVDVVQRFLDNGSTCNTGSSDAYGSCWDGLSTTDEAIASSGNSNHPSGATTTVLFRVGIGGSVNQLGGTYVATTTLTALPL